MEDTASRCLNGAATSPVAVAPGVARSLGHDVWDGPPVQWTPGGTMTTTISWVDHDENARRTMRSILDDFTEKSAVDELGLGVVRDALAEALYPGTSTLHRRPRYMLFIAWTYRDLIHKGLAGTRAIESASASEHQVRKALTRYYKDQGDQAGIIGLRAGESLKRLPSVVYWAALRRYGIRHESASGSVDAYCHLLAGYQRGRARQSLLRAGDEPPEDPAQLWAELPEADPDRFEETSFDLTPAEALFLRERIVRSEAKVRVPENTSMLAWLAGRDVWDEEVGPHDLVDDPDVPARTRDVLRWSRLFDLSVHGARLLYNLMCSEQRGLDGLRDRYRNDLEQWRAEALAKDLPTSWPAREFWAWMSVARPSGLARAERFHARWMQCLEDTDLAVADDSTARALLVEREVQLKRSLARLYPGGSRRLDLYEGDAGIRHYDYNWSIAKRVLDDVHAALGTGA